MVQIQEKTQKQQASMTQTFWKLISKTWEERFIRSTSFYNKRGLLQNFSLKIAFLTESYFEWK